MNFNLIETLQVRTASAAIGASTARNMGPAGTIAAARLFLKNLNLARFNVETPELFKEELDQATSEFVKSMPVDAQHWGSCRKFINIFLRDAVYNKYLSEHFQLAHTLNWLEVPLDSHIARGLRAEDEGRSIPRWKTVIRLDEESSNKYQEFARTVAARLGTAPVHLDILYWRRP